MNRLMMQVLLLSSAGVILFNSCGKDKDATQNLAPVANAGNDQMIILPADTANLNGSGSDADGHIINFEWRVRELIGGRYVITRYASSNVKLKNLKQGTYWCEFIVWDDGGLTDSDESIINVVITAPASCPCFPDPCDSYGDPCDPWD